MDLIQKIEGNGQKKAGKIIFELLLVLALSVGCWYSYFSMFPSPVGQEVSAGAMVILPLALYGAAQNEYIKRYMIFYIFLLVAAYFVFAYKLVWNGFLVLANIIVETLNEQTALGLIGFETAGDAQQWTRDAAMALFPVMLLVSAAVVSGVRQKEPLGGFVLTALPVLIGLCLDGTPSVWLLVLLMLGWTGMFVLCAVEPPESRGRRKLLYIRSSKYSRLPFLFLGVMLVISLCYVLLFSGADYRPFEKVDQAKQRMVTVTEHLRYDRLKGDPADYLSRGNLRDTHPLNYTDTPVLKLAAQVPRSMYLRGFVGGMYENQQWSDDDSWPYTEEYKGVTQWLAQQKFYPWCQRDALFRMAPDYDLADVTVENLNASSKYTYLPYETAMTEQITPDKVNFRRDQALYSRGIRGDREYTFTMFLPPFDGYEPAKIQSWLSGIRGSEDYGDYFEKEQVYQRFVYDTYLWLPPEAEKAMEGTGMEKCLGKTAEYTLNTIRKLFDTDFQYNIGTEKAPKGQDELAYFLQKSKTGNDMHFATAAALMLRKAGIPARYAEGYYLSPDFIEGYTAMDNVKLDILDSQAHSWVEIYIDEVGWFPVEVIPGYYTLEKEKSPEKEEQETITQEEEKIFPDEAEIDEQPNQKKPKTPEKFNPAWLILPILLLLAAAYELAGRLSLAKMRKRFSEVQGRRQVYDIYRYVAKLLAFDGIRLSENPYEQAEEAGKRYDAHIGMPFGELLRMVGQVRFGDMDLSLEEQKKMAACAIALSRHIYGKQNAGRKFRMKFIVFYV